MTGALVPGAPAASPVGFVREIQDVQAPLAPLVLQSRGTSLVAEGSVEQAPVRPRRRARRGVTVGLEPPR